MCRTPGTVVVDGPTGRRAAVEGTGLDVWEVIATWKAAEGSYELLRGNYPWLMTTQLPAALAYYEVYPREVDARLEREACWTPERVWSELPFSRPSKR